MLLRHGPLALAVVTMAALFATDTNALMMPFRYEHDAQLHCPTDTVVWLDFKKRKYYQSNQRLYGHGFHGSYVCLEEARRNLYRRSLLGRR
jgi:hypothetical protein